MPLRVKQHIKGIAKCKLLHEALSVTGLEKWGVQFIPYPGISRKALQSVERWYICKLKTKHPDGYNMREGANPSLEQKERRSKHLVSDRVSWKAQGRERRQVSDREAAELEVSGDVHAYAEATGQSERTAYRRTEKARKQTKAERNAEVKRRAAAGEKQYKIADALGISQSTVSRVLKR